MSEKAPTIEDLVRMAHEEYDELVEGINGQGPVEAALDRETIRDGFASHAENFIEGHLEILVDDGIVSREQSDEMFVRAMNAIDPAYLGS